MKTKKNRVLALLVAGLWLQLLPATAQITIPGATDSDGVLNATGTNYVINLANAQTGVWTDAPTTNGVGIYDSEKWAVVFKYSSVNIPAGTTVTFINHPKHAPVVWLVSGNVTINGTLDLSGSFGGYDPLNLVEGGPGGFRGGAREQANLGHSGGFGPGGAYDGHGFYKPYYGNSQIFPLIGGSGGSAYGGGNGGGGGGAILIAVAGNITISGTIYANGGNSQGAYVGSGGSIRLVANQVLGAGQVQATSVVYPGRVRVEANVVSPNLLLNPIVLPVPPNPVVIWPTNAPTVRVVGVSGQPAPNDPLVTLGNNLPADLAVTNSGPATILLETVNFPTNGTINVFIKPRNSAQATYQASLMGGTTNLANWQVQTNLPLGYFVIQARAVTP